MRKFVVLTTLMAAMTAVLILPISTVAAATTTVTFNIAGIEYDANFAQSSSAGAAVSVSRTEFGVWNAVVPHDLGAITGGTFSFRSKQHTFDGTITGGTFTPNAGGTCAKTTFGVHGDLSGGGSFDMTLTHYGFTKDGTCVVYLATVRGTATLAFPS